MGFCKYKYRISNTVLRTKRTTVELIVLGLRLFPILYDTANRTLHSSDNVPVSMGRALSCVGKYRDNPLHLAAMTFLPRGRIEEIPVLGAVFMLDTFLRAMRTEHPELYIIDKNSVLVLTPFVGIGNGIYQMYCPTGRIDRVRLTNLLQYLEQVAERLEWLCSQQ